jgi:hypothetical protein
MGEKKNAYWFLVRELEGKRPLRRPRYRLGDDIKADLSERVCDGMNCIDLAEDRKGLRAVKDTVLSLQVPYNATKFLKSCTTGGLSKRALLHGVNLDTLRP